MFATETANIGRQATCKACRRTFKIQLAPEHQVTVARQVQSASPCLTPPLWRPTKKPRTLRMLAVIVTLVGCYWAFLPNRSPKLATADPTVEYWNAIFAKNKDEAHWPTWQKELPAFIRSGCDDLSKLPIEGVDQLAVGTSERLREFLYELANLVDHLNWMKEHPHQTGMSGMLGGQVHPKWVIKVQECKRPAEEFNQFAGRAYQRLIEKFGSARVNAPFDFPVGIWDEQVLKAKSEEQIMQTLGKIASLGFFGTS